MKKKSNICEDRRSREPAYDTIKRIYDLLKRLKTALKTNRKNQK